MSVILWRFCIEAPCRLFPRGEVRQLQNLWRSRLWFFGVVKKGLECTADDEYLPPRTIVRDELKESRQTLVDLQQKLADGSNKRGQEMHGLTGLFWLCFVCFISNWFHLISPGLFQLWYCPACSSARHPRIFNLRSQRRELEEERYSALSHSHTLVEDRSYGGTWVFLLKGQYVSLRLLLHHALSAVRDLAIWRSCAESKQRCILRALHQQLWLRSWSSTWRTCASKPSVFALEHKFKKKDPG